MSAPGVVSRGGAQVTVAGETLLLLPSRCVYWPRRELLLAADMHLGKEHTFQRAGLGVPAQALAADLARLNGELAATRATSLWILGDFIHHQSGLTEPVLATIAQWRRAHPSLQVQLVAGNHDRASHKLLRSIGLTLADDPQMLEPFVLAHDFNPETLEPEYPFALTGHLHPVVSFEEYLLPAFYFTQTYAVLPAFSQFTGGLRVRARQATHLLAIAEGRVVQLK